MSISTKVIRKLWASSGGVCARPDCHADLFSFFEDGTITNIEELAHIIGQKMAGPRGNTMLPLAERDEFENVVVLCPTCHTLIDKNPKLFPENTVRTWKNEHYEAIKGLFSVPKFHSRDEAAFYLKPILAENKAFFDLYGPYSQKAISDPLATGLIWERTAIQKILPNNRKIEKVIEVNQDLLQGNEFSLFTEFKLHREGFEFNKISGDVNAAVVTFPNGFEFIFT